MVYQQEINRQVQRPASGTQKESEQYPSNTDYVFTCIEFCASGRA